MIVKRGGSQEIGHECAVVLALRAFGDGFEDDEVAIGVFVEVQEGGLVVHAVAVVGGRPERDQLFVEPVDVPFLYQLVRAHDQRQVVEQVEVVDHLVSEDPPRAPRVASPGLDVLGVRPHEIGQRAFVGDFLFAVEEAHLVDGGQVGGESAVDAEEVAVDDCAEGEEVEGFVEVLPAVGVAVLLVDLIEEAVHHGDVAAFVVAAEQVDAVGVLDLEAEEEGDGFDGVVAAVDEVADEDELVVGHAAALRDQVLHVEELPVHVARDVHWRVHAHDVRLLRQHPLHQVAQRTHG